MALTSEDYLLGLEKEIMGSDYYKILEINTKETKRRNNIEVLENIDEINDRISKIEENLNKINPDFIWVGLGAPKQEIWMSEHKNKVNGLMIGVGAGFDYHAENISRAPKWMQRMSLEWLYRLCQDPKRLFKRYFKTNLKFIKLLSLNKI